VSDSIPLEYAEHEGYGRNVVILTQPLGYCKRHLKLMPLVRIGLRKYPAMVKAMDRRHVMYNRQLDYVAEAEREGRCLVIRPDGPLKIGHVSHDPEEMERVYQEGRKMGVRRIKDIVEWYGK
jgi:predicted patatin/cPLA2 family phospholipase